VFGFVAQVRAAIFHPDDAGIGIAGRFPVLVGDLLLPLFVAGLVELEFPTDGGRWLRSMRPLRTGLGFGSLRRSVYGSGCRTLRCIQTGSLEPLLGSDTARDAPILSSRWRRTIPSVHYHNSCLCDSLNT
jgi:hypothetical protein